MTSANVTNFHIFTVKHRRRKEVWDGAKPWGLGDEVDPPEAEEFQK